jgi:exodeoxyribonuclease (lambda-induced)
MKSLKEILALHQQFEKKFGYKIAGAEQQSEAWFNTKLGVISASKISCVTAKPGSATRYTYMCDLVAQILTGLHSDVKAVAMDWGNQHEDAARAYYEARAKVKMIRLPFVFKDDTYREGCSPDGYINSKRGAEIKCPFNSTNFVKFLHSGEIDSDWEKQVQHGMRVLGAEQWDFGQYDPRSHGKMLKFVTIDRDEKYQKTMEDAVPDFINEMDKILESVGVKFGEQWTRLKEQENTINA